ncbi:hypothetical protein B0J12DRAFT_359610 [Macrophomina phaseolina]|uniref:Uncharacterized protein n=1 Tax=Macrophomina phaseolina TaxID=35725 RepID=A0ABQ8FWM8_9PEZI|nr:hypothetical protein B0J12DRAFT_359610 [Macrophomina phaseolina]
MAAGPAALHIGQHEELRPPPREAPVCLTSSPALPSLSFAPLACCFPLPLSSLAVPARASRAPPRRYETLHCRWRLPSRTKRARCLLVLPSLVFCFFFFPSPVRPARQTGSKRSCRATLPASTVALHRTPCLPFHRAFDPSSPSSLLNKAAARLIANSNL